MSRASPQLLALARSLIADEPTGGQRSSAKLPAAFDVLDKLRIYMEPLMGKAGFRALLSRALSLAAQEAAELRRMQVNADSSLGWISEPAPHLSPDRALAGSAALLAQSLGLLVAFVGEILTFQIVREVWPKVSFDPWSFDEGEKHEKTS